MAKRGVCPDCGAKLIECSPAEVHPKYAAVPKDLTYGKKCEADCGFGAVQLGPQFLMTAPRENDDLDVNGVPIGGKDVEE